MTDFSVVPAPLLLFLFFGTCHSLLLSSRCSYTLLILVGHIRDWIVGQNRKPKSKDGKVRGKSCERRDPLLRELPKGVGVGTNINKLPFLLFVFCFCFFELPV